MTNIKIIIISDSSGGTAYYDSKTVMSQFPKINPTYRRFPFINNQKGLDKALDDAKRSNAIIFDTLVSPKLNKTVYDFAKWNHLVLVDCLHQPVSSIKNHYHIQPILQTGMVHKLTPEYFDKISAIAFATRNDDGKNPDSILKADIVIIGPSRTSKSPVSFYLAQNYGLKVVNVPVSPQTQLPKQISQVDTKKIFGLLNSVQLLHNIRCDRLRHMGLTNTNTPYTNPKNIQQELDYAKKLYKKVGCRVINVENKSIEETSAVILEDLGINC